MAGADRTEEKRWRKRERRKQRDEKEYWFGCIDWTLTWAREPKHKETKSHWGENLRLLRVKWGEKKSVAT